MNNRQIHFVLLVYVLLIVGVQGCQRETPAEKAQPPQPASTVDQAAQQAVDAIKTPMDEARGVEGTLGQAADRTADKAKEASQ
jgi:hypothetical protein